MNVLQGKKRVKVTSVLNQISRHGIIKWSQGVSPSLLTLAAEEGEELASRLHLLYAQVNSPQYLSSGSKHLVWILWRTAKSLVPARNQTQIPHLSNLQPTH
jgi:hypothetical protein